MDRAQAVEAMTVLVCEQGFTETAAREILAADLGYDILCHMCYPDIALNITT